MSFCLHVLSFGSLPNVNGEHYYLWSHSGHPIAKAELVCPIHVGCKCVLPAGLPVSFIDSFIIWSCDLHVDVQEAALRHLEDEAHLGAGGDPLEEALLGVRVDADKVARGRGQQRGQQRQQLGERHHGAGRADAGTRTAASGAAATAAASAAPCLKNAAALGPGVLQATRAFHTGQPRLAPLPPLPEYGGKVRLGLIPEEFFQFLYPKTGVTGPYVLGTGLSLYFLSKEIYVITPETFSTISVVGLIVYVIKKYGASFGEFIDKLNEEKIAQLEEVKQSSMKQIQDAIDMEKAQQALVQKRHYLFDVQRNNIALALEVTYRERLHKAYKEVKNRLDYHISVQNMMRRKEEEHMIDWVEKHVVKSISVQQEKETIAKCIEDLKLLAKKAQAQPIM